MAAVFDKDGARYDERGRRVFRTRKHDIEEFRCIVERHGCYKTDLVAFAQAIVDKRKAPLFTSGAEGNRKRVQ